MADSRRQDRVAALIQRELSEIIQRSVKDPRVTFCTVTQAEVSADLKYVDVKVSVIGDDVQKEKTLAGLKSATGFLRREIGKRLTLRYSPELRFAIDESADYLLRIDGLLKSVNSDDETSDNQTADLT